MNKLKLCVLASSLLISLPLMAESMSFNGTTYNVTKTSKQLAAGVTYTHYIIDRGSSSYTSGSSIHVVEADLTNPSVIVKHGDSGRDSRRSLATQAANLSNSNATVVAGANANFWCTSETPFSTKLKYEPFGASIKDGHMYSDPNCGTLAHVGGPTTTGLLAIDENGKCYIDYLKAQQPANGVGSGWNFTLTNNTHPHTFGLDQTNGVSVPGTASMYTSIYGSAKAFRPVTSAGDYSTSTATDWYEVLMDFADGTTQWNIGGETKLVIKEIRAKTSGNGTLGSYDCAIVGNQSYGSVMSNWAVGDEMVVTARINFASKGSPARVLQATSGNCICMANGVVGYNSSQESYNSTNYARTLYGTNDTGTKLWIAVCEHYPNRQYTYLGFTTKAMAEFLKLLGATWATQVDCGGSAQMYAGGSQVSTSTDSGGLRNVQSGIFILSANNSGGGDDGGNTDPTDPALGTMNPYLHYEDLEIAQLAGKTIKRVVPNKSGSALYILAHDAAMNPTLLVYDHVAKAVKEELGTSGCVAKRDVDTSILSDIAVTDDNVLIGIGRTTIASTSGIGIYTYRWTSDSNGIATGNASHWNVANRYGNWGTADCGESMAYNGTTSNGYLYYSARTTGSSGKIRWERQQINSVGQIGAVLYNLQTVSGDLAANPGNISMQGTPWGNKNQFVVSSSSAYAPNLVDFVESERGQATSTTGSSALSSGVRHTQIFTHGGNHYMVAANASGFTAANINNGLTSATKITTDIKTLSSNTTTNVAAAATSLGASDYAVFLVRDGKISKYATTALAPSAPVLSGSAYVGSDGKAYGKFTWTAPDFVEYFDTQHKVNGEWITFQDGFGATFTTLDYVMPDQESKSWTLRVRARNASGVSSWSNEITVAVTSALSATPVGSTALTVSTSDVTLPYFDIDVVGTGLSSKITYSAINSAVIVTALSWDELHGGTLRVTANPEKGVGSYSGYVAVQSGTNRHEINYTVNITQGITPEEEIEITALDEVWNYSTNVGNLASATYFTSTAPNTRDMCYANGQLYVLNSSASAQSISIVDAETGIATGKTLSTEGISGGTYALSGIKSLGNTVIGTNICGATAELKVYKWDSDTANPTLWFSTTNHGNMEVGRSFNTSGDMTNGYIAFGSTTGVVYYKVSNGEIVDTPISFTAELKGNASNQSIAVLSDGSLWLNNKDNFPMHLNSSGVVISNLTSLKSDKVCGTAIKAFDFGGRKYIAYTSTLGSAESTSWGNGTMLLVNVSDESNPILIGNSCYPSNGLGAAAWGTVGSNAIDFDASKDTLKLWVMVPNQGIAMYRFKKITTGVDDIEAIDENTPAIFYNLNGVRVDSENLIPGIYIKIQNGKSQKILVK